MNKMGFLAAAVAGAFISACGGGGDAGTVRQTATGFTVDGGLAQKGPLVLGSSVRINELSGTSYMPAGTVYDVSVNDNLGGFSLKGINFGRQFLEITAQGYYFNELTGVPANDNITLHAKSDLTQDRLVNVNTLTSLASDRITALVTRSVNPLPFTAARAQAQREALAAFYIYNSADLMPGGVDSLGALVPANFSELDISKAAAANQILTAVSSLAVSSGINGVGISTFLATFAADLADDGLINNSPGFATSVRSQIDTAAAAVSFGTVATNLNAFYKSTSYVAANISQWVDSSGGVDKVIDKYKFADSSLVGAESRSPNYGAGSNDVGQCISVSAGNLYRNGGAVNGTVKALAGDAYQIGLTGIAAGALSGFIQRSSPSSTGLCPVVVPPTGTDRLLKYSVAVADGVVNGGRVTVSTLAGSGSAGSVDGIGAQASFSSPYGVAVDSSGNVFAADTSNHKIRKITPAGVVTTLAGSGSAGSVDGVGTAASFNSPVSLAVDTSGNVYVADFGNNKIRKITPAGLVTTLAGSGGRGSADGIGASASFSVTYGVAVDTSGNVYVADCYNHKIRKITPAGVVTTLAGSGSAGSVDGVGIQASFYIPVSLAADGGGNIYVADQGNNKIRKITSAGVVTTLAGSGSAGSVDGVGVAASFNIPDGIAVDAIGNIYVAEYGSNKIRQMTSTGVVTTLAGSGSTGSVDGTGPAAGFSRPAGLAVESIGNVYVADQVNNKIRKIAGVFSINVSKLSGDLQAVVQHASLALPFKVLITDAQNRPVANIPVTFSALTGYFSKNPYTVNSGADGIATLQPLTVGGQNYGYVQKGFGYFHTVGLQQVYATALGFPTTVFNVDVTPSIHAYDGYYLCPTSGGLLIDNQFEIINGSITKQNLFGPGRYVDFSELDGSFTASVGYNYRANFLGQISIDSLQAARLAGTYTDATYLAQKNTIIGTWSCSRI